MTAPECKMSLILSEVEGRGGRPGGKPSFDVAQDEGVLPLTWSL